MQPVLRSSLLRRVEVQSGGVGSHTGSAEKGPGTTERLRRDIFVVIIRPKHHPAPGGADIPGIVRHAGKMSFLAELENFFV